MYEEIKQDLLNKYGKSTLTKNEVAKELGIGLTTLDKHMAEGMNLPKYLKMGNSKNSRVVFPIVEVAKYLSNVVKTMY